MCDTVRGVVRERVGDVEDLERIWSNCLVQGAVVIKDIKLRIDSQVRLPVQYLIS
jgi:hypothetical protein